MNEVTVRLMGSKTSCPNEVYEHLSIKTKEDCNNSEILKTLPYSNRLFEDWIGHCEQNDRYN